MAFTTALFLVSVGSYFCGIEFCPVLSMTTRFAYLFLLSENAVIPLVRLIFSLSLVLCIGPELGASFFPLIWIVRLLIWPRRFPMGSFKLPRALPLLVVIFLQPVFADVV